MKIKRIMTGGPGPAEGQIVYIQGYEMTAHHAYTTLDGLVRFTGRCTADPRNDSIRNTSYNGGGYGWRAFFTGEGAK